MLIERGENAVLTNIEYCDFAKFGIQDLPLKEGEPYSRFSSNTNILFADLKAISAAVERAPFPGLLINLKKGSYTTETGEKKEEAMARLGELSRREMDVLKGLLAGKSNKMIAIDLGISSRTVEAYRANMMDKLQVRSLPEAVRLAIAGGVRG